MRHRLAGGLCALGLFGCGGGEDVATPHVVGHQPPTGKDVIVAAMASHDVSLDVHPSCDGVGTDAADLTIGDYLGGFLAALDSSDGGNWLETSVVSARTDSGVDVWRAELLVRHAAGDDEWGWGVRFDVRQTDGTVDPASFECIGGG